MSRAAAVVAALVAALAVLVTGPAFAHNTLTGADPGNGASVATSPKTVTVHFNAPVQDGPNQMTVTGPDGTSRWQATETAIVDGNSVHVPVRELGPAGRYTVGYRIISADGHPVSGSTTFTLTTAGHGRPVAASASAATASGSGGGGGVPVWVWIVIAVVVLGGGAVVAARLSRASTD